ncbi:MAG: pyridoxamine 5'-phosphate oxidase family protein [Candidatus Omnitrophica bacterium]|nr:pyridoxamine 5'-phosphate oxidase family protein [Candidatus Omnitrophota bacterium]
MKRLNENIAHFLRSQNFVIVSTVGRDGTPHNSCKGIVKIDGSGRIYLLDLYKERTYENLRHNRRMSITAVDEHKFAGFCLKGVAKVIREDRLQPHIIREWEAKITQRITHRVLKNISGQKGHPRHPEVALPTPEYMIVMDVKEIVNLTPHHIKQQG